MSNTQTLHSQTVEGSKSTFLSWNSWKGHVNWILLKHCSRTDWTRPITEQWCHSLTPLELRQTVCVCVFLPASPSRKVGIASLHQLNSPIRFKGVVPLGRWVCVSLPVMCKPPTNRNFAAAAAAKFELLVFPSIWPTCVVAIMDVRVNVPSSSRCFSLTVSVAQRLISQNLDQEPSAQHLLNICATSA